MELLKGTSNDGTTSSPKSMKWENGMRLRKWFSIDEAACIATGCHPREMEVWGWDNWPREVESMRQAIKDATPELELDLDNWGGEAQGHHKVSHESISAWCTANDIPWPLLPRIEHNPASDEYLIKKLEASEAREVKLKQELATLKSEYDALLQQAIDEHTSRLEISHQLNEQERQPQKPHTNISREATLPPLISLAIQVFQEHWQGQLEPSEEVRARANQDSIVQGLQEQYPELTQAVAKAIDKVASPIDRNPKNQSGKYQLGKK